jgi:GTP-binding protein Era
MSEVPLMFRSGFVALVGRPNVGKSTLLNAILNQKIAAVSHQPQTTRRQQLGILTTESAQIIFVDTPGLHVPQHKLGDFMNQAALDAIQDADVIVWIVDSSQPPTKEDRLISDRLNSIAEKPPMILMMNKIDLLNEADREIRTENFMRLLPQADLVQTSAIAREQTEAIISTIIEKLPEGPAYYDAEQVTDIYEKDIAAELVREATLLYLEKEVPHCVAVRIDEFKDRSETNSYVAATIFVERDSQKGIVIGKGGEMIKRIGQKAREQIEEMSGRKIFLELRVKVSKNWRNNPDALKMMGYSKEES